jgi:hypothetical protein
MVLAALNLVTIPDAQPPFTLRLSDGGTAECTFVQSIPPLAPVTVPATLYALTPLPLNLRTGTASVADLTSYTLTAPAPLINRRIVVDATTYALTGVAPVVTRLSLTVQPDGTLLGFGSNGDITVTITSPTAQQGTYTVDQSNEGGGANLNVAALLTAPQAVVKPIISRSIDADGTGTTTVGDTLSVLAAIWLYDGDDAPSVAGQWSRNASPIDGATDANYVIPPGGTGTYTFVGTMTGAGVTRTVTSNSIVVGGATQTLAVPVTTYAMSALTPFLNLGTWSITSGDASATVVSFPLVPTSPAWSVTAGDASATINAYPGGA